MIDEKKMELLKKLRALAERGDRGEKAAAQRKLDELLQKYNIDEADLADDTLDMHWFNYRGDFERRLLHQIANKVNPDRGIYQYTHGPGKNTKQAVECTTAEAVQIQIEFEFYKQLWSEELRFFFSAFIQKHQIFDTRPGCKTSDGGSHEEMMRMAALMTGMQDRTLHPMIEGGQD